MTKAPSASVRGSGYVRGTLHGTREFGLVWGKGLGAWELEPLGERGTEADAWAALREYWRKPVDRVTRRTTR